MFSLVETSVWQLQQISKKANFKQGLLPQASKVSQKIASISVNVYPLTASAKQLFGFSSRTDKRF